MAFDIATLRRKTVQVALQHVGQHEEPPGSNRGQLPDSALAYVGAPMGVAWCAAAGCYFLHLAGVHNGPKTASSGGIVQWGKMHGAVDRTAQYGDLGEVIDASSPTGFRHTVIVIGGTNDALSCVECNYSDGVKLTHFRKLSDLVLVNPYILG